MHVHYYVDEEVSFVSELGATREEKEEENVTVLSMTELQYSSSSEEEVLTDEGGKD